MFLRRCDYEVFCLGTVFLFLFFGDCWLRWKCCVLRIWMFSVVGGRLDFSYLVCEVFFYEEVGRGYMLFFKLDLFFFSLE